MKVKRSVILEGVKERRLPRWMDKFPRNRRVESCGSGYRRDRDRAKGLKEVWMQ